MDSVAVEALGAGLVAVDFGETCVDGGIGNDQPVDVCEPEEAPRTGHLNDRRPWAERSQRNGFEAAPRRADPPGPEESSINSGLVKGF